jgi:hypothetical protein
MKWLLTTGADVDAAAVRRELEAVGGSLDARDPIPLAGDEQVFYGKGPEDLHERLKAASIPIAASPDSEMELY